MQLDKIKIDGSENGGSAAAKINAAIDAINLGAGINMTPALGINIDTITDTGYYEVDTNLPVAFSALGEVRVGHDTTSHSKIIQEYRDLDTPEGMRRISADGGLNWTAWVDTPQSVFNNLVVAEIELKASRSYVNKAIVNTFTGTAIPSSSLGKSGDQYHRYETSTPKIISSGVSKDDYDASGFYILDEISSPNTQEIYIDVENRAVLMGWGTPIDHIDTLVLRVNGTDIPLTVTFQVPSGIDAIYDPGFDSIVQAIIAGSTYELNSMELQGKNEDYTKFDDMWFFTPVFDQTYDFQKAGISEGGNPIVITDTTYQPVVELVTLPRATGVYEYKFSLTFAYSTSTRSAMFQWSLNGGTTWEEYELEVKDPNNKMPRTYEFPITRAQAGTIHLVLQAKCEGASDTLTIDYASIIAERKK